MKLNELFLEQLDAETKSTRRALERVPEGRNDWKPHEKSMPLGYLAALVAKMPGWIAMMINLDEYDLNTKDAKFQPKDLNTNRELVTSGKLYGYCYTEKKYLNFTLRYEFRHTRPVDLDPDDEYYEGNNGTLLFINDHRVWPKGIEIQGKNTELMRAFGMDARVTATDYPEAREKAYKPVGQWHKAEVGFVRLAQQRADFRNFVVKTGHIYRHIKAIEQLAGGFPISDVGCQQQ